MIWPGWKGYSYILLSGQKNPGRIMGPGGSTSKPCYEVGLLKTTYYQKQTSRRDSNPLPTDYRSVALTNELHADGLHIIGGGARDQPLIKTARLRPHLASLPLVRLLTISIPTVFARICSAQIRLVPQICQVFH